MAMREYDDLAQELDSEGNMNANVQYTTAPLDLRGGFLLCRRGRCRITMNEQLSKSQQAAGIVALRKHLGVARMEERALYIWSVDTGDSNATSSPHQ